MRLWSRLSAYSSASLRIWGDRIKECCQVWADPWHRHVLATCTPTFPLGGTVITTFENAFSHALWKASFLAVPTACTL